MEAVITALASHGATGLVAAALLYLLMRKDAELTAERAARVEDAKGYTKMALELSDRVHATVEKVADWAERAGKGK